MQVNPASETIGAYLGFHWLRGSTRLVRRRPSVPAMVWAAARSARQVVAVLAVLQAVEVGERVRGHLLAGRGGELADQRAGEVLGVGSSDSPIGSR